MREELDCNAIAFPEVLTGNSSDHPLLDDFLSRAARPTSPIRSDKSTAELPQCEFVNAHVSADNQSTQVAAEGDAGIRPSESAPGKTEQSAWPKELLDFEKELLDEISKTGQEFNKHREFGILLHLRAAIHDIKSGTGDVNSQPEARFNRCKAEYFDLKGDPQKSADELIKAIANTLASRCTVATSEQDHRHLAGDYAKLADIFRRMGDAKAAQACFESGIEQLKGWYGNDAARQLCRDYQRFLQDQGKTEEAKNWKKIELTLLPSEHEYQHYKQTAIPWATKDLYEELVKDLKKLKTKTN
jgi:tetratricopeptide (TPR) repeat protein